MKIKYIPLVILAMVPTPGIAQDQGCGTPPQCYAKAAAMLNNAVKQIGPMQDEIGRLENIVSRQGALINALQSRLHSLEDDVTAIKNMPTPQVGVMPCYKKFATTNPITNTGGTQILVEFAPPDCQNVKPKQGWTYVPTLIGTTICGGFVEYLISPDPFKPNIHFYGRPFCPGTDSEVWVNYIGFSPRAF
jgi:hypothetical protein